MTIRLTRRTNLKELFVSSVDEELESGIVRSPRYPKLSLEEAVAKVEAIYEEDKTAGTPVSAAIRHMGFRAQSGPANTALAALKRFGLLESRNGRVYPTQRAVAILKLPESDDRRRNALREAIMAPEVYREILSKYKSTGLPSQESLEHELLLEGRFNHNAVPALVADFFSSLKFAGLTDLKGVTLDHDDIHEESPGIAENDRQPPEKQFKRRQMQAGMKEDVFSLDEGAVVLQWPDRLSRTSAEDMKEWLDLISKKVDRAAASAELDDILTTLDKNPSGLTVDEVADAIGASRRRAAIGRRLAELQEYGEIECDDGKYKRQAGGAKIDFR